jgi:PleD family two-component response regulator
MEGQVRTRSGPVTISAGLVMHAGGTDAAAPLSRAGEALAHARRMGRSRVVESASQSRAA